MDDHNLSENNTKGKGFWQKNEFLSCYNVSICIHKWIVSQVDHPYFRKTFKVVGSKFIPGTEIVLLPSCTITVPKLLCLTEWYKRE